MAMFSFKCSSTGKGNGNGFSVPVGAVRDVTAGSKREYAIVHVVWGGTHAKQTKVGKKARGDQRIVEMVAIGDWKKLRKRWKALLAAQQGR